MAYVMSKPEMPPLPRRSLFAKKVGLSKSPEVDRSGGTVGPGRGTQPIEGADPKPVAAPATTYRYRDPEKRRAYLKDYMKRYRAKQKEKGNG